MPAVASLGAKLTAHPHRRRHAGPTVVHWLRRLDPSRVDERAVPQDMRLTVGARLPAGPHDADAVDVVPVVESPCALAAEPVLAGEAAGPAMEPDGVAYGTRRQLRRCWLRARKAPARRGADASAAVAEGTNDSEGLDVVIGVAFPDAGLAAAESADEAACPAIEPRLEDVLLSVGGKAAHRRRRGSVNAGHCHFFSRESDTLSREHGMLDFTEERHSVIQARPHYLEWSCVIDLVRGCRPSRPRPTFLGRLKIFAIRSRFVGRLCFLNAVYKILPRLRPNRCPIQFSTKR
jgi:hypothetical protein